MSATPHSCHRPYAICAGLGFSVTPESALQHSKSSDTRSQVALDKPLSPHAIEAKLFPSADECSLRYV